MRDFFEMMQLRQLTGGSSWIEAVCLLGLFALVVLRRESIVNWRMFRLAYLFLALSIMLPPLILAGFQAEPGTFSQMGSTSSIAGRLGISLALNATGPLFLALSIVCAFGSILPRHTFGGTPAAAPAKHPLD